MSTAATASAFILGAAAALAVVASTGAHRPVPRRSDAVRAPLELVALEHDRDADSFIVRGIVRNSAADAVTGLTAEVAVFAPDGELITTGRAAVATSSLAPGEETPFVVIVSSTGQVDRYHLSFQTAAGVLPHLDRRAHGVLADLS